MKKIVYFLFLIILISSCGTKKESNSAKLPTKQEMKDSILVMEDSLKVLYQKVMEENYKIPSLAIIETRNRLLAYYALFPKDEYSGQCLDKVQQLYLQEKAYEQSLAYVDTLLMKFPKYKGKADALLNAGSTGEVLNDTAIIGKYYRKLLLEVPNIDKETKEMVQFRLKNLSLSFDELIELQMKKNSSK